MDVKTVKEFYNRNILQLCKPSRFYGWHITQAKKYYLLTFSLILISFLILTKSSFAQHTFSAFKKGDKVAFIGNSITHTGIYHEYIHLFHLTRYPYSYFDIGNFGVAGDVAMGGIQRWHGSVKAFNPTIVIVMFGMNDVNRGLYRDEIPALEQERNYKARIKALSDYRANMDSMLSIIKSQRANIVLLTPSIYEENTVTEVTNNKGVNGALGMAAEHVKQLAKRYQADVVDFHKNMNYFNERNQLLDSTFSLIGNDRVHPERDGHFFMAYTFLSAQQHQKNVANMSIDLNNKTVNCENCNLSDIDFQASLSFDVTAYALPFPIDDEIKEMAALTNFGTELNQEKLSIVGLEEGIYQLSIDEQTIASFSYLELRNGINLTNYYQTPQYQQAQKVFELNKKWRTTISDSLQAIQMIEYFNLKEHSPPYDLAEAKVVLAKALKQIEGESYYGWVKSQHELYLTIKPLESAIKKRTNKLLEQIWLENKPIKRHYKLTKTD